jgi:hypothetical protein
VTASLLAAVRAELGDEVLGVTGLLARAAGSRWPVAADGAELVAAPPVVRGRVSEPVTTGPMVPEPVVAEVAEPVFEQPVLHPVLVGAGPSAAGVGGPA